MQEINRLTKDEDLQQELWVFFLEGESPFLLQEHLDKIQSQQDIEKRILTYVSMESLWH